MERCAAQREIRFATLSATRRRFFRTWRSLFSGCEKKKNRASIGNASEALLSRQAALRRYDGGDTQFRGFMKIRDVMRDHNVTPT